MHAVVVNGTFNSSQQRESPPRGRTPLAFLTGGEHQAASNLIQDWFANCVHGVGMKEISAKQARDALHSLLNFARVAPWKLTPDHVIKYLDSAAARKSDGKPLAPNTIATRCAAWRSFQKYMLDQDRANEILKQFKVRPRVFVNDENSIGVKRHKANWVPKAVALTTSEIAAMDEVFRFKIKQAHHHGSKALRPLQRDRVMFHVAIHYALRVSELVTLTVGQFGSSGDELLERFGRWAMLRVHGKNDVTGVIPTRESDVANSIEWYMTKVRQDILLGSKRRNTEGMTTFRDVEFKVADLIFPSERATVISPTCFRKRLTQIAFEAGLEKKVVPHTLRHTGCTLMVPLYSAEIAQKFMRHKNLHTTLYYYHPSPLSAANEVNAALALFDEDDED